MLRGDLVRVYKITRGTVKVCTHSPLPTVEVSITRRQKLIVRGERFKSDLVVYFC